jgi:hypothetical protein
VGSLDHALGQLLARTMNRMQLGEAVADTPGRLSPEVAPEDFVVTGALERTSYRHVFSMLTCMALGLFGVPCARSEYELAYQVALYRGGDAEHPIFVKSYHFRDGGVGGVWQTPPSLYRLLLEGFERTLPETAADLALASAQAGPLAANDEPPSR